VPAKSSLFISPQIPKKKKEGLAGVLGKNADSETTGPSRKEDPRR